MLSSKADLSVLLNGTQTNKIAVYEGIEQNLKRETLTSKNVENLIQFFKKVLSDGNDGDKEELFRWWMGFSKNSKRLCVELIQEICNGVWNQSIVKEIVGSLIVNQTLDLGECFKQINNDQLCHKVIDTLIQISPSIPLKPYLNFIHISTIRDIFNMQDDSTRALLCLFVLRVIKSVEFGLEACDEQIRIYVLDNFKNVYVMIIEDLRRSNNRIWYDLCIFTFRYFGKLMHNEIGLLNTLLSNIENGFRSKIVEDKILSFECWKVLIEVASLDRNYLCSSKQLKLLIKPLKIKLSRNDSVTAKRLEVWLYLLTALQENSLQCLEEFMNFCFEAETSIVKDVWLQRTEVFMNIIGHCEMGDCCVSPRTFTLNEPLIDGLNILMYKKAVLNALTICSENILIWEIKAEREKKIRCMWISILRIISALHTLDKELMLRDLFAVIASFWTKNKENREYFDDILQPIFNILSNLDSESFDCLMLNEIIVFPMAQLMLNTQDIPEYIALSFVNLLRSCSKTGSMVEYLNRSCELLRTYFQNRTQVLSAYIWLELTIGMLNVCRSPKDYRFEEVITSLSFLMCWICQCQIPENLQKIICDKWISIMTEVDVICKDFNDTIILKHFEKVLKENPSFASNILGFIPFSIEKINEKSSITYVTKVLDIVLKILTIPCLNKNKVPLVLPIISKITEIIGKVGNPNEYESISSKLFECIEYLLKPHQVYEVLILLKKEILPKLSQSAKKRLPSKLCTIINDLTTHSIAEVSKNAILLMADLNTQRLSKPTINYRTPSVSSRTAKIASLASANQKPLNLFAQTVQNSPVTVKGSVINNMSTPKSSRSLKIANAMPTFTKPNSINDANSKDFVYIDSEVKVDYSKMVSHQKEVLKRRKEDIPALYQDLSQSQHSSDSLSRSNDILNVENEQKIPEGKSNVIILRNIILSPKRSFDKVESEETSDEAKPNGSDSFTSETDLSNLYVDENSVDEGESNENKLICQNDGNQTIKNRRGRKSKKGKEKQMDADISEIKIENIKSILPTVKTRRSSISRSNEPNGTKTEDKNEIDLNIPDNANEEKSSNLDETDCSIDLIAQINNQLKDKKVVRVMKQLKMDIVGGDKLSQWDTSKERLRNKRNTPNKEFTNDKINKWKEKNKIYKANIPINNENNSENIVETQALTEELKMNAIPEENKKSKESPQKQHKNEIANESISSQSNIEIGEGHNDEVNASLKNNSQESNGKIMKKKKKNSVNVDEEKRSNLDETLCNMDLITQTNNPPNLSLENQSNIGIGEGPNDDVTKSLENNSQESDGTIIKRRKKRSVNVDEEKRSNLDETLCNIDLITQTNNPSNLSYENQSNIEFGEGHNNDVTKSLKNNSQESDGKIMKKMKTRSGNVDKEKRSNLDETLYNIDLITQTNNPSNLSLENQSNIEFGEGHNDDVTKSLKNNSEESNRKIMKKRGKKSVNVDEEKRSNLDETLCNLDLITQTNNQFKSNKVDEEKQKRKTRRLEKQLKMDIVGAEKLSALDNSKQRLIRRRITPRKILKKANIQQIFPINNENNSENIIDTQALTNELKMKTPQTQDENEMKDTNKSIDLNEPISNPTISSLENYSNIKIENDHNQGDNTNFKNSLQDSDKKPVAKRKIEISRLQMNIVGANSYVGVTQKRNSILRSGDGFKSIIGVKKRRRSDSNVNNNVKRRRRSKKIDLDHNKKENETEDILSECLLIQSTDKTNEDKKNENVAKIDEDIIENSQPQNESIFHFGKSGITLTKNSVIKNESNSPAYITFLPLLFSPSKDKKDTVCCGTNNLIDTNGSSLKDCLDRHANKCNENTLLIDLPDTPDISISIDFEAQNTNDSNKELSTKSLESTNSSPKSFNNKTEQNTNQLKQPFPNTIIMSLNEINKGKASVNIDLRNEGKSSTLSPSVIALRDSDESNLFDQINSNNINKSSPNNQSTNESKRRSSMESLKSSDNNKFSNSAVSSDLIVIENVLNDDRNQTTTESSPKKSPFMVSNMAKDFEQKSNTVESTLSDTLSCDPNNSISIIIQEVLLPVEPTKIEVPKTTLNPLENITLDDFPTGLNKNDEQNLPGSPILEDRNFELLNNTVDISPIRLDDGGLKENIENVNKVEPEIINNNLDSENCKIDSNSDFIFELPSDIAHFKSEVANNFMKAPSSRSIKLMNLLPQQSVVDMRKSSKSVNSIKKQCTNVNGSPTSTERVRRMMLNCNGNKSTSLEGEKDKGKNDEKFETINVLEFRRNVPSPFATPNRSILKRKACEALECGLSPGPKRKRVNFSDPPTTVEKIYYKEETEENDYSVKTRKSAPIYPPLINCPNDIKEVLKLINEDNNFYDNFISLKLTTVGDLAKLSSTRVNQMEFLSNPKVSTIINALSAFADKYNSKDKLEEQVERSMIPSEDPSLPVNGDTENNALLVSPFERLERLDTNISDMWQNLKNLCTRQQLMLISEDLQEYLGPN